MVSGGPRQGTPGTTYTNRTDLNTNRQPVQAPPGQAYGERKAQEDAQRAIPLPQAPPVVGLGAPTQRPDEPLTAGLPFGDGPGPDILGPTAYLDIADDTELEIRELMARYPQYTSDLARVLEFYDK